MFVFVSYDLYKTEYIYEDVSKYIDNYFVDKKIGKLIRFIDKDEYKILG